jgi:hypothetical protein
VNYLLNLLVAIDQLGNAVAGGNPDVTVSGRVGYQSAATEHWFWRTLERIIDLTFEPVDGRNHCLMTAYKDNDVDLSGGSMLMLGVLSIIAVTSCLVIAPFLRVFGYSKKLFLSCRTK